MTRTEALTIACQQFKVYQDADIEAMFGRGPEPNGADYGYRHGWVTVDGHSFNNEDLTGHKYDSTQGGWAFL